MKNICCFVLVAAVIGAMIQHARAAETGPGADLPWVTYEAEQATTNGKVFGPDYTGQTAAREASGRQYVRLAAAGEFLEFTAKDDAQGLVVRYSIPDSADGIGMDATLSLYINGQQRNKLPMTSKYSHLYGRFPFNNQPNTGSPRDFWDELRIIPSPIHRGDVIRLQKDADDTAAEYLIDFVDLETVPAPLERPADALSITEFGAVADGPSDARPAFVAAIAAAKQQHKSVWIPVGHFVMKGSIQVADVAIHGAGMWYSTLVGVDDYQPANRVAVYGNGSNVTLSDFAIIGKLNYRQDNQPNDGIGGSYGTGSIIRNIWVEHTKTGAWITNSDGLVVEGCRFRDTLADGINLQTGMRNTTVLNCTTRGGGDDCFAMWPAGGRAAYQPGGNRFVHCTGQLPFLAQAFSIYGGDGNSCEDCKAIDIPYGAGAFASTTFRTQFGFRGITTFSRMEIIRCGGPGDDGAIGLVANLVDLTGLRFEDINITDTPTDGIRFTSPARGGGHVLGDTQFNRIRIVNAGLSGTGYGIDETDGALGSATISNVTVINPKSGNCRYNTSAFNLILGAGNVGIEKNPNPTSQPAVSPASRP